MTGSGRSSTRTSGGSRAFGGSTGAVGAVVAVVVAALVVVAGGVGLVVWHRHSAAAAEKRAEQQAVGALVAAWNAGHLDKLTWRGGAASGVQQEYQRITAGLGSGADVKVSAGTPRQTTKGLSVPVTVAWTFGPQRTWSYASTATFVAGGDKQPTWVPVWTPSLVQPTLQGTDRLRATRVEPERAPILGANDTPLVAERPVVDIGVQPNRTSDPAATADALAKLTGVDAESLAKRIQAAKPTAFVPVITLRTADYQPKRDQIRAVPGVVTRDSTLPLAPTREFARALLGTSGEVTAEIVKDSDGRYRAGDVAGLSGLQRQYDAQLAGSPGLTVERLHPGDAPAQATQKTTLWKVAPQPGTPLRTTLDERVQIAADNALQGVSAPAALVAVRPSDGHVLAVGNSPATGLNRAMVGRYAPGSTFKVVTTLALLNDGVTTSTPVACPEYATVNGKSFHNYEHETYPTAPFSVAFAKSCNTAFISLSPKLADNDLPQAAAALGIGTDWKLGAPAFSGDVPAATGPVDKAAQSFGQGRTAVSPLAMAVMSASVEAAHTVTPQLVLNPSPNAAASGSPSASASPPSDLLTPQRAQTLQQLMRLVVTDGTGTVLKGLPGGPVSAKTGTAEFGNDDPPQTHVWLVGFQGDLAFAAFVETGDSGAGTAGPIVERFLTALASS